MKADGVNSSPAAGKFRTQEGPVFHSGYKGWKD